MNDVSNKGWRGRMTSAMMSANCSSTWGRDLQRWRVRARGSTIETGGGAWKHLRLVEAREARGFWHKLLWRHIQTPLATGLPRMSRSTEEDLCGNCRKLIGVMFEAVMRRAVVFVLHNSNSCRSGTQGRRLGDVKGSTARSCSFCCDGGRNIENGVTPIKTRLLRKY